MALRPGKYDPLKPDIELFDFKSKKRFGLKLDGQGALQVGTISQDDTVHIRAAGKRVGDFDEQRSWKTGRGKEKLSEDAAGYWDSNNAWTLTDGHLHQTLLWRPARGLRSCDFFLPDKTHSMYWKALVSSERYLAVQFTATASYSANYARMWVRRVGRPGTLTLTLYSTSAGLPGSALKTATININDITDTVSQFRIFDWAGTEALVSGTSYYIVMSGASTDNATNHWEIGGYNSGTGQTSADGSTWNAGTFQAYSYVADSDIARTFHPFFLDEAMYVVSVNDSRAVGKIYLNGDRGKSTATSYTVVTDSSKSWTTNQWAGAWVKIIRGSGFGQTAEIASNTATTLTLSSPLAIPDNTDSEYIIYATEYWTEITGTGLDFLMGPPLVVNQIVYFPQGPTKRIRRMVWDSSTAAHAFSSETSNYATFLAKGFDQNGTKIWRVTNSYSIWQGTTVSYATAVSGANPPTDLTFGAAKVVGDKIAQATGIVAKEGSLYIFKEDGIYVVDSFFNLTKLETGMEKTPSTANGRASIVHQQFVYYSYQHSLIRVYGSSHDDVGQDWASSGLPDGREGEFAYLDAYTSLLIGAIDAKSGTSSVLGFDGIGWHELLRAYDSNKRIRMTKIQPCEGTRNRHWTEIGGDLVYQELPLMKGSPRLDSGVRYQHEAVIESATIDMGTASGLPKYIKELTVFCTNLGDGNEIAVDYQVDDDVHTSNWTHATILYESPESVAFLGLSNIRQFAYRLRIRSSDNTSPVDVQGVTPNGYARSPYKMVWTLRCRADNITSRGRLVKPDVLMRWLLDNARYPGRIEMRSQYQLAHLFHVIVHPPRMFPFKPAQNGQSEESVFTIVLEEA